MIKNIKTAAILLFCAFICGCGTLKNIKTNKNSEKIYSSGSVQYSHTEKPKDIIAKAVINAKRNALRQIIETFVTPDVAKMRAKDLEEYILSKPDKYITQYKLTKEKQTDTDYSVSLKSYIKVTAVFEELSRMKLIGRVKPRRVVIMTKIKSTVYGVSYTSIIKSLTAKLAENLYTAALLKTDASVNLDTLLEKTFQSKSDYLMIVEADIKEITRTGEFISGFYPYSADVNLKIYSAVKKGGAVIDITKQAGGFAPGMKVSAENALKKAVNLILKEIPFPFEKVKQAGAPITLEVMGLNTLEKLKKFYNTLLETDMIIDFSLRHYKKGGDVVFAVNISKESGEELAAALLRQKPFELAIESVSQYKIQLKAI